MLSLVSPPLCHTNAPIYLSNVDACYRWGFNCISQHAFTSPLDVKTMNDPEDAKVIQLCQSAFHAEHYGKFAEAYRLHGKAIQGLTNLIENAGFLDRERKRIARKQIKFHTARQQLIRPSKDGTQGELPLILPTSVSAKEEMLTVRDGALSISLVETQPGFKGSVLMLMLSRRRSGWRNTRLTRHPTRGWLRNQRCDTCSKRPSLPTRQPLILTFQFSATTSM